MKECKINRQSLAKLFDNLRYEDLEELKVCLKNNTRENFIQLCLKCKEKYMLCDENNIPIAIGGAEPHYFNNLRVGQVWLICSKNIENYKKDVFRYIKNKIENFQSKYDILYNYIYKTNFKSLKWLNKCGFISICTKDKNFKFFYFKQKEKKFDIRYITGK